MNSQRLSLSDSVFESRIKKFDSYQHDSRKSLRADPKISHSPNTHHNARQKQTSLSPTPHRQSDRSSNFKPIEVQLSSTQKLALSVVSKSTSSTTKSSFDLQFISPDFTKSIKKKPSKPHLVFYVVGLLIFLFAGGVSVQTLLVNKQAKEQIGVLGDKTNTFDNQGVEEGTGGDPSESIITAQTVANYKTDPELPRVITIPDIGVYARIKHTGTKNGAVDAPWNVNDVSWFIESARPGNTIGSSLLLGHVSGWTSAGVFKKLDKLKPGARIEIEKGNGEKLTYEVVRGEKIPIDQLDMTKILGSEVDGEHDLKLMTCAGRYSKDTDQYEERYVVYAKILR